ncbi:hypothetical protein OSTOST_03105 [Ostertagia ostertagi]
MATILVDAQKFYTATDAARAISKLHDWLIWLLKAKDGIIAKLTEMTTAKMNSSDGVDEYVEVDIVSFMNCIRPRGPKFSVNRKRIIKLVDDAAAKSAQENAQLKSKINEL